MKLENGLNALWISFFLFSLPTLIKDLLCKQICSFWYPVPFVQRLRVSSSNFFVI